MKDHSCEKVIATRFQKKMKKMCVCVCVCVCASCSVMWRDVIYCNAVKAMQSNAMHVVKAMQSNAMHVDKHVYLYAYICVNMALYIVINMCARAFIHTYIHTYIYIYIYIYIYACAWMCIFCCVCVYVYVSCNQTQHTHTQIFCSTLWVSSRRACKTHTHIYIYIHIYIPKHIQIMYVCTCMYVYILWLCVCLHVACCMSCHAMLPCHAMQCVLRGWHQFTAGFKAASVTNRIVRNRSSPTAFRQCEACFSSLTWDGRTPTSPRRFQLQPMFSER